MGNKLWILYSVVPWYFYKYNKRLHITITSIFSNLPLFLHVTWIRPETPALHWWMKSCEWRSHWKTDPWIHITWECLVCNNQYRGVKSLWEKKDCVRSCPDMFWGRKIKNSMEYPPGRTRGGDNITSLRLNSKFRQWHVCGGIWWILGFVEMCRQVSSFFIIVRIKSAGFHSNLYVVQIC